MMTQRPSSPSSPSVLIAVAIAAALLGGAASAFLVMARSPDASIQSATGTTDLDAMHRRLEHLEAELAKSNSAVPVVQRGGAQSPVEREPASGAMDRLLQRLEAVEHALVGLGKPSAEASKPVLAAVPPDAAIAKQTPESQIAAGQEVILDPGRSDQEKLRAWGELRSHPNGWNDAVVATMTHLGLNHADATVRADVWRQADARSTNPAMGQALLRALQADQEAKVREEAAETLENYLDLPGVRDALAYARDRDVDEAVRRQATRTLTAAKKR